MKKAIIITAAVAFIALTLSACGVSQGIKGTIIDSIYGDRIPGIEVTLVNLDKMYNQKTTALSDDDGSFIIQADAGKYRIETNDEELNYRRHIKPIEIPEGVFEYNIEVEPIVKTWIHGTVVEYEPGKSNSEEYKTKVADAEIEIDGIKYITDKDGNFEIKYLRPGLKKITIKAVGYKDFTKAYNLSRGETIEYFEIEPSGTTRREKVSKLSKLYSYRSDVLRGTSQSNITETSSIIANTSPFAFTIESTLGNAKLTLGQSYLKQGDSYVEVDASEIENLKTIVNWSADLVDGLADYINADEALSLSDITVSASGYGCQPFEFEYSDESSKKWNVSFWTIIDGQFVTYPARVIMTSDNEYIEIDFFAFNLFENHKAIYDN